MEKEDLLAFIDQYLPIFPSNRAILVITSKIVSICEGSYLPIKNTEKEKLIKKEADFYFPTKQRTFTMQNGFLMTAAGIDESNGSKNYILWPRNPQETANKIRKHLQQKYSTKKIGVIITDSRSIPFRRGVVGMPIAYSGFSPFKDYRGKEDLFGRKIKSVMANLVDGLAIAAVTVMGECNEMTPLAIITDIPFIEFKKENPSLEELNFLQVAPEEDIYAPFFKKIRWKNPRKTKIKNNFLLKFIYKALHKSLL